MESVRKGKFISLPKKKTYVIINPFNKREREALFKLVRDRVSHSLRLETINAEERSKVIGFLILTLFVDLLVLVNGVLQVVTKYSYTSSGYSVFEVIITNVVLLALFISTIVFILFPAIRKVYVEINLMGWFFLLCVRSYYSTVVSGSPILLVACIMILDFFYQDTMWVKCVNLFFYYAYLVAMVFYNGIGALYKLDIGEFLRHSRGLKFIFDSGAWYSAYLILLCCWWYYLFKSKKKRDDDYERMAMFGADIEKLTRVYINNLVVKDDVELTLLEKVLKTTGKRYLEDRKFFPAELKYREFFKLEEEEEEEKKYLDSRSSRNSTVLSEKEFNSLGMVKEIEEEKEILKKKRKKKKKERKKKKEKKNPNRFSFTNTEKSVSIRHSFINYRKKMELKEIVVIAFELYGYEDTELPCIGRSKRIHNNKRATEKFFELCEQYAHKSRNLGVICHYVFGNVIVCTLNSIRRNVEMEKVGIKYVLEIMDKYRAKLKMFHNIRVRACIFRQPCVCGFLNSRSYHQFVLMSLQFDLLYYYLGFADYLDVEVVSDRNVAKKVEIFINVFECDRFIHNGKKFHMYVVEGKLSDFVGSDDWINIQSKVEEEGSTNDIIEVFWKLVQEKRISLAKEKLAFFEDEIPDKVKYYLLNHVLQENSVWRGMGK